MLAIVIPYFKIDFFKETLASLSNQNDKRFNVYIGNDNSPDDPKELINKSSFNYTYNKFKNNLGGKNLVRQWERCIDMVENEEWVMILGDDDVLEENIVAEFYNNIEAVKEKGINVIRYGTYKINEKGDKISEIYKHPIIETSIDFMFRNTRSSLSEYIFKKEKIEEIKFKNFPLAWYSDVLAVLEFSEFKDIYSINEVNVLVRISSLNISGDKTKKKEKRISRSMYYSYLLMNKSFYFTSNQKKLLLNMLDKTYINSKKSFFIFFRIFYVHMMVFKFKYFFNFLKNISTSFIKR